MAAASIVGSIAIWCATFVGVAAIIDTLMPEWMRKRLIDRTIALWMWLDDQRDVPFLARLSTHRARVGITLLAQILSLVIGFYAVTFEATFLAIFKKPTLWESINWHMTAGWLTSMLISTTILFPYLLSWASNGAGMFIYQLKLCSFALLILILAYMIAASSLESRFVRGVAADLVFTATLIITLTFTIESLILVAKGLVRSVTYLMQRLAEHPKGPVVAASALVGGIGAVLKAFSS